MAAIAFFRCRNVIRRLAGGDNTVMTAAACSCYKAVVEDCVMPGIRTVAEITFGGGDNVFWRFAGSGKSIMA